MADRVCTREFVHLLLDCYLYQDQGMNDYDAIAHRVIRLVDAAVEGIETYEDVMQSMAVELQEFLKTKEA